jgi:hypothetical protein
MKKALVLVALLTLSFLAGCRASGGIEVDDTRAPGLRKGDAVAAAPQYRG